MLAINLRQPIAPFIRGLFVGLSLKKAASVKKLLLRNDLDFLHYYSVIALRKPLTLTLDPLG